MMERHRPAASSVSGQRAVCAEHYIWKHAPGLPSRAGRDTPFGGSCTAHADDGAGRLITAVEESQSATDYDEPTRRTQAVSRLPKDPRTEGWTGVSKPDSDPASLRTELVAHACA